MVLTKAGKPALLYRRPPFRAREDYERFGCPDRFQATPSCRRRHCWTFSRVRGSSAKRLAVGRTGPYRRPRIRVEVFRHGRAQRVFRRLPNAASLHSPQFVPRHYWSRWCAVEVKGKPLVVRRSAATRPYHRVLSLLRKDGQLAWSLPLSKLTKNKRAQVRVLKQAKGKLLLVLTNRNRSMLVVVTISNGGKVLRILRAEP